MRTSLALLMATAVLAGCTTAPTLVDQQFGQAVIRARAQQVIDPDAPTRVRPVSGVDGQASRAAIDRYEKTFEVPPPPVNVLNIGVGSSSTGTR